MKRIRLPLLLIMLATLAACGTTNSGDMYDPNAPVPALTISSSGMVDSSARSITLPTGGDAQLLAAFQNAFTADGWAVSTDPGKSRYMMNLQIQVWTYSEKLSSINLSIVDIKTGKEILTGARKAYSPDEPIDVKGVAGFLIDSLKKITQ